MTVDIRRTTTFDSCFASGMHQPVEMQADLDEYLAEMFRDKLGELSSIIQSYIVGSAMSMWRDYRDYCDDGSDPLNEMFSFCSGHDDQIEEFLDSLT